MAMSRLSFAPTLSLRPGLVALNTHLTFNLFVLDLTRFLQSIHQQRQEIVSILFIND